MRSEPGQSGRRLQSILTTAALGGAVIRTPCVSDAADPPTADDPAPSEVPKTGG